MAKEGTRKSCGFCFIAFFILLVSLVGLAVVLTLHFVVFKQDQYGLVFDAGSSHTDLSMFRWPGEKIEETGVVVEVTQCRADGSGISSYANTPAEAGESIMTCLLEAKKKVPEDRLKVTPIYLGATAGMRLLNIDSPTKAKAVINAIEDKFKASGFKYNDGNVQIINGVEEGISAWISANLLLGNLGEDGSKETTVGAMDMGGASTQIAFETPNKAEESRKEDQQNLRLYGFDFPVFAHSYLCFGLDEAVKRFKADLAKAAPEGQFNIDNPCLLDNFTEDVLVKNLFNTTCTPMAPPNTNANTKYRFIGTGKSDECAQKVYDFLNATKCRNNKHSECFDTTIVPDIPSDKKILAIAGYYFTAKFFSALNSTPDSFKKKVEDYCALTWPKPRDQSKDPDEFLSRYCFVGHYIHQVLAHMYRFNTEEKWKKIEFSKSIAGVSAGWKLGFMTNATNTLPVEAIRSISSTVFIALLVVFLVLLLIVAIVGCVALARSRRHAASFG